MESANGEGLRLEWLGPIPEGRPAVVTGVFDLLHVGHARFLAQVREKGHPVVIGVEADNRVRAWKGPERPINTAAVRAELLAALRPVDGVFIISGPPDVATWQHYTELLRPLRPVALAFTEGDPFRAEKRLGAEHLGAEVWEMPLTRARSSTALIEAGKQPK